MFCQLKPEMQLFSSHRIPIICWLSAFLYLMKIFSNIYSNKYSEDSSIAFMFKRREREEKEKENREVLK